MTEMRSLYALDPAIGDAFVKKPSNFKQGLQALLAHPRRLGELGMVKSAISGATLPGDVYAGREGMALPTQMTREQGMRVADMAGLAMTGGVAGTGAGGVALGSGPIKAYHGSPHDFEKFSLQHIGKGEGAQAYGHGLYFAENEGVAKSYRDALRPGSGSDPVDIASRLLQATGDNQELALSEIRRRIDAANARGADYSDVQRLMTVKNIINTSPHKATGRMYEVNIHADPERFLDWDKPVSTELFNRTRTPEGVAGLRDEGIPGIKYFDAGSRGAGEGSRNYVVFNDNLVEILRKYGLGSLAVLGGGAAGIAGDAGVRQ